MYNVVFGRHNREVNKKERRKSWGQYTLKYVNPYRVSTVSKKSKKKVLNKKRSLVY